ncbi:MAG: hypothetical protein IKH30_03115 [Clostridia bacterium]|nr:hypothetical protein [Clostridia bacterium]
MSQVYQLRPGHSFLIQLADHVSVQIDQALGIRDLLIDLMRGCRVIADGQPRRFQLVQLFQAGRLFLIKLVGPPDILGQGAFRGDSAVQLLTRFVYLGDGTAQFIIALPGFGQGTVLIQLFRGGKQGLNLRLGGLHPLGHLLSSRAGSLRRLLNLSLIPGQHILDLLFHHVGDIQVNARPDGFQQRVGFGYILPEPRQIQVLCADQLILTLCHGSPHFPYVQFASFTFEKRSFSASTKRVKLFGQRRFVCTEANLRKKACYYRHFRVKYL